MLTNEEILKIITNNKDSYVQIIKAKYKDFYNKIQLNYTGITFGEKLYKYIYGDDFKCKNCNGNVRFQSFQTGYTIYCSKKCSNKATAGDRAKSLIETNKEKHYDYYEKINCAICGKEFEALKYREQKCCSGKCSGIYVAQLPNRIEKL